MTGRVAEEMMEERSGRRKAPRAANLIGTGDKDKGSDGSQGTGKNEARYCYDCGEQGHIRVNCPYTRNNSTDEEDDQGSSWECEHEAEKPEELVSLEAFDDEGETGGREWGQSNGGYGDNTHTLCNRATLEAFTSWKTLAW